MRTALAVSLMLCAGVALAGVATADCLILCDGPPDPPCKPHCDDPDPPGHPCDPHCDVPDWT